MSGLLVWLLQPMATWPCCPGPVVKQPIVEGYMMECSCSLQGRRGSREGTVERKCHEARKSKAFDREVGGKVTWWGT